MDPIPLFPKLGMEKDPNAQAFITNRCAEGWNSHIQAISLGQISSAFLDDLENHPKSPEATRVSSQHAQLERLLTFGRDIPGAFWVLDADLDPQVEKAHLEIIRHAATAGRNTVAGAQPKILGVQPKSRHYYPTRFNEEDRTAQLSTHIFKIGSAESKNQDVIIAEFLAMEATKALLPEDKIVDGKIIELKLNENTNVPALALRRFDRTPAGGRRHFTEMTELLGLTSKQKFEGSYWHMAKVLNPKGEIAGPAYEQSKLLYERIIAHFLVGNFDNHLKNFAIFDDTKTLTPNYDVESVEVFGFKQSALDIMGDRRMDKAITPKMLVELGAEIGVTFEDMRKIFEHFKTTVPLAQDAIQHACIDDTIIRESAVNPIRKKMQTNLHDRWERYKNIDKEIDKSEATYKERAAMGINIKNFMQPAIYGQFAPERLKPHTHEEVINIVGTGNFSGSARQ